MDWRHYASCSWPGLADLWWRGRLSALPTAVAFALGLNALLITRFLYPEWLSGGLVRAACWIGLVAWLLAVFRAARELPQLISPRSVSEQPDRFTEAHSAYLAGNWETCEEALLQVLSVEARDPPALLLLAGVYRHTGRLDAAAEVLRQAARTEAADAWWLEREAEERRLERAIKAAAPEEEPSTDSGEGPPRSAAATTTGSDSRESATWAD